ncbi:MAG: DNA replication/repair protein RecF [Longimicrobiaceae bacterium]
MTLSRIRLRDFRNFADQELEVPPDGCAIVADNGRGKTNLLEAIYYLEIFRSFRGAPDAQLVRFGTDTFHLEGEVGGEDRAERLAAGFSRRGKIKKITVGGAEPERLGDAIGRFGAVVFSPGDIVLVSGPPSGRRRYLDILLSLAEPGYLVALQRYRQALQQRNALLRQGAAAELVASWNAGLVDWGSRVVSARVRWTGASEPAFAEHYARIAGGAEARLSYHTTLPDIAGDESPTAEVLRSAFAAGLQRSAASELRRGNTLVGPHRDDLRFTLATAGGQLDLRAYGSGGQQRTAAIALRMTEMDTVRAQRERAGVLLLDDVFAELDQGRSARIADWVAESRAQVVLTAPRDGEFLPGGGVLERWTIRDGRIHPL